MDAVDELAVGLSAEGFRPLDPLLLVQVTEFTCRGFVVAVTQNHAVANSMGFAQFMWGCVRRPRAGR